MKAKKKRSGIKSTLTLLILIIAGGAIFYFGWIKNSLQPGEAGVIISKTGGIDAKAVEPGRFLWRWENIIPANTRLETYKELETSLLLTYQAQLPSGEYYSQMLDHRPDFGYSYKLRVNLKLHASQLPALAKKGITPDQLSAYWQTIEESLEEASINTIQKAIATGTAVGIFLQTDALEEELLEKMTELRLSAEITKLMLIDLHYPDLNLYRDAQTLSQTLMENQAVYEEKKMEIDIENQARWDDLMNRLKSYGTLLAEYPALINLLNSDPETVQKLLFLDKQDSTPQNED